MKKEYNKIEIYDLESSYDSVELFRWMAENQIPDILEIFGGDPDKLKINDEEILFTGIEAMDTLYIVYHTHSMKLAPEIESILKCFFSVGFKKHFVKKCSIWSEYKDHCIAYRGGRGYHYTIWKYTVPDNHQNDSLKAASNEAAFFSYKH